MEMIQLIEFCKEICADLESVKNLLHNGLEIKADRKLQGVRTKSSILLSKLREYNNVVIQSNQNVSDGSNPESGVR